MLIRFSTAHGRGEVQIELELVLRQFVLARIDVGNGRRRGGLGFGQEQHFFDGLLGRAGVARQLGGMKHGSIGDAAHQGKTRLEVEDVFLDAIGAEHRRLLFSLAVALDVDGEQRLPLFRRLLELGQGFQFLRQQSGDIDGRRFLTTEANDGRASRRFRRLLLGRLAAGVFNGGAGGGEKNGQ